MIWALMRTEGRTGWDLLTDLSTDRGGLRGGGVLPVGVTSSSLFSPFPAGSAAT
eukprot:SAG31_NODE_30631_length_378_cov_0.924731_1_plen_53_part_10